MQLTEILIPESLLTNFEEQEEIEALSADIVDMANCFEEDGFHAEISDIDFSNAYCVFIEANILGEVPKTKEELEKLLASARKVWNIPVYADGNTVLVQVSRSLELSEIEQDNLTEEEIETIKEKAGKWHTVSSTRYEDGVIPEQGIGEILSTNHKNTDKCECVLIGGESGIQTLIALVIENDEVSDAISLERAVSYTSSVGVIVNEVVLQENQMYSLDEFAKVVAQNSKESFSSGNGEKEVQKMQGVFVMVFYIVTVAAMIAGCVLLIQWLRKFFSEKK